MNHQHRTWEDRIVAAMPANGNPIELSRLYERIGAKAQNQKAKVRQVLQRLRDTSDAEHLGLGIWVVPNKVKARLKWRQRVSERSTAGQCCDCRRRALPGEQRCKKHKARNRRRCLEWMAARRENGICTACRGPEPRPAAPGRRDCQQCLDEAYLRRRQSGRARLNWHVTWTETGLHSDGSTTMRPGFYPADDGAGRPADCIVAPGWWVAQYVDKHRKLVEQMRGPGAGESLFTRSDAVEAWAKRRGWPHP